MTAVASSLSPVSAGVFTALNVPSFLAICTHGVGDDIPEGVQFPYLLFEVQEAYAGALGTKPTDGASYDVDLTLHAYSQYAGMRECQSILEAAIALLKDPPSVSGFSSWAIFHLDTIPIGDEIVAGVKVKELVSRHRLHVELA